LRWSRSEAGEAAAWHRRAAGRPDAGLPLGENAGFRRDTWRKTTRNYSRHWTPVHLDFVTTDIEAAVERAIAAGAILEQPVTRHAWGELALLADPFGNGFCLIKFLGRGYDEIAAPAA